MRLIVVLPFVDQAAASSSIGETSIPACCLVEDVDTGGRWMVADTDATQGSWVSARQLGALGMVKTGPLRYVSSHHVTEHGSLSASGQYTVDERWWVCPPDGILPVHPQAVTAPAKLYSPFVHLHAHSEFSPLDGLATVQEMVDEAVIHNQMAIAVTDHGYCAAHPHLQKVANAAGVRPIFGLEANLVPNRFEQTPEIRKGYWHFLLLARNEVGLRNLWAASTEAHRDGYWYRPRMDWTTLQRHSEGMIASTACLRGPLKDLILSGNDSGARAMIAKMRAIFPESLYLELHTNHIPEQIELNRALVQLGQEMSLPLISVCDAHYGKCEDHDLHKVWIAAQTDRDLNADSDLFHGHEHYFLKSADQVAEALRTQGLPESAITESMQNTVEIANQCDATIRQANARPVYHRLVAPGFDSGKSGAEKDFDEMMRLCELGWSTKVAGKQNEDVYRDRLDRESTLIRDKGFSGYFLIVWDYCDAARSGRTPAKKRILMGPGRGSVVGSLVAYLLGITAVDPIEADLLFERFITAGRNSPPDIDLDFPSSERDAVTGYITNRWGDDRVVRVGTHGRLQNKGVLRSLEKVLRSTDDAMAWPDLVELTKIIEAAEAHTAGAGLKWDELWEQEGELLEPYRIKYPVVFGYAERMVKRLKSYGRHASGVVIDPENPIIDRLPLRMAGEGDTKQAVTEFDMDALELLGYLKFDILTLRTLDTIQVCTDLVQDDYGIKVDIDNWRAEYEDPQVWDMLCHGDTLGVFQIETSSGTRLVKRMQPQSIADLSAILTLVRPGPMRSGLTDTYIKRRFGEEATVPIHPVLEPVLGRTYQCMIYQEDIMAVCSAMAGYDLEESDKVRAILGKKKVEEAAKEGVRFIDRAVANGIDEALARHTWDQMQEFAKYTFNRAHAWSYAVLAYWCAWMKCHYPVHFAVAVLSTIDKKRVPEFVEMARRNGYMVLPPDVNESKAGFSVSGDHLGVRYGFSSINDVGESAADAIIQGQPYASWDDFLARRGSKCNFGHIRKLAALGTFDSLLPEGKSRASLEALIEVLASGKTEVCRWKVEGLDGPNGLPCTFDWTSEVRLGVSGKPLKAKPLPKACSKACRNYSACEGGMPWPGAADLTPKEVRDRERRTLGVYLSSTPFDDVNLSELDSVPGLIYGESLESIGNGSHSVFAMVDRVRRHIDTNGKEMAFVTLSSFGYLTEAVVFSKKFAAFGSNLAPERLGLFSIIRDDRGTSLESLIPLNV